jgi:N,N'-diacetyllegionaminate synthase
MQIDGHSIAMHGRVFVIAEIGVNHNGDVDMAKRLIDVAADAGADAVKFQTFTADAIVTPTAAKAAYQQRNDDRSDTQYAMLRALELNAAAHEALLAHAQKRGITFLSSPFDEASADLLHTLDVPAFKIGSGEITNLPLLVHIAQLARPMILSTGMALLGEVETAVQAVCQSGCNALALLHCVSDYPADPAEANLRAMHTMAEAFGCPVGWSDHTQGAAVSLAAVALGACIIEKHFTLDRTLPGPDHAASLEPDALTEFIAQIRTVEAARGDGIKRCQPSETATAVAARKSVVTLTDIARGARLEVSMIGRRRPGSGIAPALESMVVGRCAASDLPAGTVLTWEMLS